MRNKGVETADFMQKKERVCFFVLGDGMGWDGWGGRARGA
jgi:hypothetical protein